MRSEQTVSEMVEEVLGRQARALVERTGQTFESALEAVSKTEAGRKLVQLANGSHRDEKASQWQEGLLWERTERFVDHFGVGSAVGEARRHATSTTRFWSVSWDISRDEADLEWSSCPLCVELRAFAIHSKNFQKITHLSDALPPPSAVGYCKSRVQSPPPKESRARPSSHRTGPRLYFPPASSVLLRARPGFSLSCRGSGLPRLAAGRNS
jgi:hypothetical protein